MDVLTKAKQQVLKELKSAIGKGHTPTIEELASPPNAHLGDIAFPCFVLAKAMKRSPMELAQELAAKIGKTGYIKSVKAEGPYVNFTFDEGVFGTELLEKILKKQADFGMKGAPTKKSVMVEFANLNTHKDVHIGHIRNMLVGQMTVNLLEANGHDVIPVYYINDLGAHVAACVWALLTYGHDADPEKVERMRYLAEMYRKGTKAAEQPKEKEAIKEVYLALEQQEKGDALKVWKKTRKWSIEYLNGVFDEMGLSFKERYYESAVYKRTEKILAQMEKEGLLVESQGAKIVDLEEEGLGAYLLVRSDGTLLYYAKDIGLAYQKEADYHPNKSIYVIDARQSLSMKQLFTTLKKRGFSQELVHLSYEFVTLKEGAMSSRKGTTVSYEAFRDAMIEQARAKAREQHPDWSEKEIEQTASAVAFAAIKFGMLKQDLDKKIVFDMKDALAFEGCTGPYLLYMNARIHRLLEKSEQDPNSRAATLTHPSEHALLTLLSQFPEVVFQAGQALQLSRVSLFAYDLARAYSEFYERVSVLGAETEALQQSRLALSQAVSVVLERALRLMGIEPIRKM